MGGYRTLKHVYDDNWEDKNQFKTTQEVMEEYLDSLFDSYADDDDEDEEGEEGEDDE